MSDLEDYQKRMNAHQYGAPPSGPARNVAEAMADADAAAHARGQGTAMAAGNLGWLFRLWYKGPAGKGAFLLVLQIPLIILGSALPGALGFIVLGCSLVLLVVSAVMIAYGALRRLVRGPGDKA